MSDEAHEGASPREQLLEACRRNNTSLLHDVLSTCSSPKETAHLLNTATDGVGQYCLHIAATYGSYDVLDILLDQEDLEVDPIDRLEKDTPLHKAVRFVNSHTELEWQGVIPLVELLIDAGADPSIWGEKKRAGASASTPHHHPKEKKKIRKTESRANAASLSPATTNRMRNKAKLKPIELADPRNADLRMVLQKAEFAQMAGNDVVDADAEDDEGPTGSGSDDEEG
ncbi:hypothetical protein MMC25_000730 [Agyrium rufum]|nr:hypothetical protein [Agyrium rufum]